jgi:aminoglycoside phosphotransferase (APT) family kinase protein
MITADEIVQAAGLQETFALERSPIGRGVWFYGPYVLRAHDHGALDDEMRLLRYLPASIPHASVIASGEGWVVQRRVEGEPLSAIWTALNEDTQRAAAQQLAAILMNLHQVRLSGTPSLSPGWFPALLPADILRMAEEQRERDAKLMEAVAVFTRRTMGEITPPLRWGFIHRDLHLDHVLWNGDRISALLDFESAVNAPRELELEALLRFCKARSPDFDALPGWLREDYPLLWSEAGIEKRLRLYSIEHDLRCLPDDPTALERLRAAIEG